MSRVRDRQVDKRQIRKQVLQGLHRQKEEQRRRKSEAIWRKLQRLGVFRRAKTVLCYVSLPDEVQTRPLIMQMLEAGKRVMVPTVRGEDLVLSQLRDPGRDLAPGSFGVLEPKPAALRPVPVEELDLVLVPGLAFDRRGHRLGRGRGYFDRLLARLPDTASTIGVCFDFQLFDRLPTDPHDQAVGVVVHA